jgi:hypothetical protein
MPWTPKIRCTGVQREATARAPFHSGEHASAPRAAASATPSNPTAWGWRTAVYTPTRQARRRAL